MPNDARNAIRVFEAELDAVESSVRLLQAAPKAQQIIRESMGTQWWRDLTQFHQSNLTEFQKQQNTEASARCLYVAISASFEKFIRSVMIESIRSIESSASDYNSLPETIKHNNLKWSGRALSRASDPPEEVRISYKDICANLAQCFGGTGRVALNAEAFVMEFPILSPDGVERALKRIIDASDIWDALAKDSEVRNAVNERSTRDAAKALRDFLGQFARTRNRIVHGADGEVPIQESEVLHAVAVFRSLAKTIPPEILKRVRTPKH